MQVRPRVRVNWCRPMSLRGNEFAHKLPTEPGLRDRRWKLGPPDPASGQSEQLPKSNEKYLPFGLMCSVTFTIP
jgi:hypothetical protein